MRLPLEWAAQWIKRCTAVSHLDGVAVDGICSARHVHGFGDFQDVVWHVAGRPPTVTNPPPLLPVVQHLEDESQGRGRFATFKSLLLISKII